MNKLQAVAFNALIKSALPQDTSPVSIDAVLKSRIDAYYQYKREHNGLFPDNPTRESFYDPIIYRAHELGLCVAICAGHIWLECDDTVYSFSVDYPNGYLDVDATQFLRGIAT